MPIYTLPELSDAIVRGRELADGQWLDPPADFPVLFSCRLCGIEATGCVFPNGTVFVVPNAGKLPFVSGRPVYPTAFANWRAVEAAEAVSDTKWEWQVTRSAEDSGPHLASLPDA